MLNTNRVFCLTKVSNKDLQCFTKQSHSFSCALFKASSTHPSLHVSEELFIHIKALAVRLHIEQAQMRSYFCISNASGVFEVSETEESAIFGTLCGKIVIDRIDLHMKMFQQKCHALICCSVSQKMFTYSCYISIVHDSGKLWTFASRAKMDESHKIMHGSQLASKTRSKKKWFCIKSEAYFRTIKMFCFVTLFTWASSTFSLPILITAMCALSYFSVFFFVFYSLSQYLF